MSLHERAESRDVPRVSGSPSLLAVMGSEETRNGKAPSVPGVLVASVAPVADTYVDRLAPVWPQILSYLTPTLPPPLSGLTKEECVWLSGDELARRPDELNPGSTTRSAIKAPELAVLMRTSIAFNHLASSVLYRTVITDDFWALAMDVGSPAAHPAIASKKELLHLTRALHLEYCRKGIIPEYRHLMWDASSWEWVDSFRADLADSAGQYELESIHAAFILLHASARDDTPPFPNLSTVTIGAIFGPQDDVWHALVRSSRMITDFRGKQCNMRESLDIAGRMTASVFVRSPLVNYCQRGLGGPFAWRTILKGILPHPPHPAIPTALFTRHIGMDALYNLPYAIGPRNRWVIDADLRQRFTNRNLCLTMYGGLDTHSWDGELGPMVVEIFASSPRSVLPDDQLSTEHSATFPVALADERQEMERVKRRTRKSRKRKGLSENRSLTSWESSLDAPSCVACNWTFEPGEVADWVGMGPTREELIATQQAVQAGG